jgi:gamma-glutamyltranspeptidase/glutathione hydrolase
MHLRFTQTGSLRAARFLLLLLYLPAAVAQQIPLQPEAASGFEEKSALAARRHIVSTPHAHASEAALTVLRNGGSAVDAAIAAQLVLNVVEPQSSGIGGGGFLLHFDAAGSKITAWDGRETMPAAARPERFLDAAGKPRPFQEVVATGQAVGVPGLLAMLAAAHERHGRKPWAELFAPAIRLAQDGFAVSPRLHKLIAADRHLWHSRTAAPLFFDRRGNPLAIGARLRQPELAASLRTLAQEGPAALHRGEIGRKLVAAVVEHGGDMTTADLAAYQPREREVVCGAYRKYRICSMPPPSSGGMTVLQILGILERTPFPAAAPRSGEAVHWFAEAGRLAYADRARYLGDPDFVTIPQEALLATDYLAARAALLRPDASLGTAAAGEPEKVGAGRTALHDAVAPELPATMHLSIIDADGNAASLTSSIEDAFGSRILAAGFFLNNQLTDFSFVPGGANGVAPGKRPLSSMAPTLVFDAAGRLYAVLGSPGGPRIINYVAQTLVALLDWRLRPDDALSMPHFGSRNGPTEIEHGAPPDWQAALEARGHRVASHDMTSGLQVIVRDGERWLGAADPRREGTVAGD